MGDGLAHGIGAPAEPAGYVEEEAAEVTSAALTLSKERFFLSGALAAVVASASMIAAQVSFLIELSSVFLRVG